MLKIWFSFLVQEAGLIKAALPPPLLVAAQPPSLRSCAHFAPVVAKCRTSGSRPARISGILWGAWNAEDLVFFFGTGGRTRTGTLLRASDFESDVSTNFTTPAQRGKHFRSAGRGL